MALTSTIRFRPFSHTSGTMCLLPGSSLAFQLFAGRIVAYDYSLENPCPIASIDFVNLGPLSQFTVLQDLESGKIVVSGFAKTGFVRYAILPQQDPKSWSIVFDKLKGDLDIVVGGKNTKASCGQTIVFGALSATTFARRERLFLGVDKSQEWSQVLHRSQMPEILPYLYWLSQSVVLPKSRIEQKEESLLKCLQDAKRADVLKAFKDLFLAGFCHQLVPRLHDSDYQGYQLPVACNAHASPLVLLLELKSKIRSLFFQELQGVLHILPLLPPECHSGTFSDVITQKGHKLSIEWTKHMVRRVQIIAASDDELALSFQKEITGFRCGIHCFSAPTQLKIRSGQTYLLDNFRK